jgi:recombination protein RecT
MRCAELGLEPDSALPTRRMHIVPRYNSKLQAKEATWIIDYRAQLQLARDTGLVGSIIAAEIREKDKWEYREGSDGPSLVHFAHVPDLFAPDRGPVIGYYAATRLTGGEVQVAVMSRADAEHHRDRFAPKYQGKTVGPWVDNFDAMALKTCLRKLFTLLPAGENERARALQARLDEEQRLEYGTDQIVPELPPAEEGTTKADTIKAKLKKAAGVEPTTTTSEVTDKSDKSDKSATSATAVAGTVATTATASADLFYDPSDLVK